MIRNRRLPVQRWDDKDVIAFARDKDEAVVQVFFVRHGRLIGREHFYVSGVANDTESQVLTAFVKQYYASSPFVPSTLMLQYPLDDREVILEWLSGRKGHKVREVVPQRGQKERLVELAAENARNVLTKDREKNIDWKRARNNRCCGGIWQRCSVFRQVSEGWKPLMFPISAV